MAPLGPRDRDPLALLGGPPCASPAPFATESGRFEVRAIDLNYGWNASVKLSLEFL